MEFEQFIREILRYDAEHMKADIKRKRIIWLRIKTIMDKPLKEDTQIMDQGGT